MNSKPPIPLAIEHLGPAAETLAHAFNDDPFYVWMLPTCETRVDALREYFTDKLRRALSTDTSTSLISSDGSTVLMAERLGAKGGPTYSPMESQSILAHWVSPEHLGRVTDVFAAIPHFQAPHEYLDVIGTVPEERGKGEGGQIARAWLSGLREGVEVRLDSSNTTNLTFYQRLGFTTSGLAQLPHGAGSLTSMRQIFRHA